MKLDNIKFFAKRENMDYLAELMTALPDDCIQTGGVCELIVEVSGFGIGISPSYGTTIGDLNFPEQAKSIKSTQERATFLYNNKHYAINFNPQIDLYTKDKIEKEMKQKYKIDD